MIIRLISFGFDGTIDTSKQVSLPASPVISRAVHYDVDKYFGVSTEDRTAHLFVSGLSTWDSTAIWTLADRDETDDLKIEGLAVADLTFTRDRRLMLASNSYIGTPNYGVIPALEIHGAIRDGFGLGDVVFDDFSLNNEGLPYKEHYTVGSDIIYWDRPIAIAHGGAKFFVGSNEVGSSVMIGLNLVFFPEQNYVWVYDSENNLIPNQRIPTPLGPESIKSLFAKDGWLYRYDDGSSTKTLSLFPLDWLHLPEPKSEIYPILAAPGDSIDVSTLINYADTILFDVGFEKPSWLSIDGTQLKIADDVIAKSTAYVRLRGVNPNGTSVEGEFGFYVYIRSFRQPEWKDFSDLGMFADQRLNMLAFADTADFVEWQHGFYTAFTS